MQLIIMLFINITLSLDLKLRKVLAFLGYIIHYKD